MDCCCPSEARAEGGRGTTCSRTPASASLHPISSGYRNNVPGWEPAAEKFTCGTDISMFPFAAPTHRSMSAWSATALSSSTPCGPAPFESKMEVKTPMGSASLLSPVAPRSGYKTSSSSRASTGPTARHSFRRSITREESPVDGKSGEYGSAFDCSPMISVPPSPWSSSPQVPSQFPTLQSGQNSVVQQETQGYESSCLLASRCLEQDSAAISPRESSPLPRFRSHRLPCDSPRASVNYPATGRPLHYPPPHSPLLGEAMISQPDVVSGYSCSNVHTPAKQQMASSAQQLSVEDPQASSSVPKGTHTRDGEISDWALGRCPSGHRLSGSPPQNLPFSCRNISNETISEENATSRSAGEVSDLRPRLSAAASGFHQQESPNQAHSEQVLQRLVTGGKMSDPRREFSQAGVPEARRSQPPPATLPGPAFGELYRLSAPATASCSLPYEEGDDSNNILRSQTPVGGLLPVALPKNETANPLLSHTMASCNRMFSTAPGKLVSDMQLIPPRPMDYWSPNDSATENGISPFILTAVPSLQRGSDLPSAVALGVDAPTGTSAPSGLCHSLTKLPLENEIETERLMSWSGSESAVQREAGYSASMPDAASRDLYKGSTQGRALQFEVVSERGPLATTGLNRTHARNPALPLKNVASGLRDVAGQTNAGTIFSPTDASVFGIPTWMERQKSAEGHLRDRCPTPNVSAANTVLTASSDCLHSDLIRNRVREPMSSTAFGYRFTGQPWDFVGLGRYSGAQRHQNRDACSSTNKPDGVQESVASFVLSTTSASADPFGSTVFCSLKESEQDGILDGCYDSEEDKQLRRLLTPLLDSSFEQELFQMQFDFQQERQWKQRVALFIGMEAAQIARLDCRNHAPTSKSNSGANVNSPQHDLAASLDETGLLLPKLPPGDLQFGNFMHASEPAVHEQLGVDKDKRRGKHHGTNGVGGTAGERFLTEDSLQLQSDLCTVVVDTEGTKCSRQRTRKADKSTGDEGRLGSESSLCETLREEHQPDSWMHAAAPSNASQHCIACDTNSDHDTQKPCLVDSIITEEKIEPSISCVSNRCSTYMNARHYRKAICGREGLSVNNAVADSTESVDFCPALNNFSDMESRCVPLVVPPRESGYPTSTVPFDIDESGHKNSEDKKHEVDAQVIRSTDEAHAIPEVKNMENSTNGFHTAAQGKMHPGCEKVSSQADSTFAASTVYKSDREVEACRAINGCRATRITDARVEKKHREIRHSLCNSESDGFTETTPHSHLSTVIHSADHGHIGQSVNPYRWNGEHLATTGGEQHTELSHSERHRPSDASRWVKTSDEENKDESEISLHGSDRAAYLEDAECASSRDKGKCTFQEEGSEPASSARSLPLTLKQDDASIEPKVEKEVQEGAGNHKMPERTSARTLGLNVGSENKTPTSVSADQKGSEPERYPGRREEDLPHQEGDAGTSIVANPKEETLQDAQCPGKPSHSPSPEYTTSRGEQKTRQGDEVGEIPEWSSENETALGVRRLVSSDSDFLGIQENKGRRRLVLQLHRRRRRREGLCLPLPVAWMGSAANGRSLWGNLNQAPQLRGIVQP